jgi:Fur family peroxide stress response transcriptional regulator
MITDKQAGQYRNSRQRSALIELLKSTKSHPTASWIYDELKKEFPDLSQGTVYRNLSVLAEQGLVQVLRSGSTFDRFDADVSAHYHVICTVCGKVEDVDMKVDASGDTAAAESTGYRISGHRLDFYGVCPDCQKKEG